MSTGSEPAEGIRWWLIALVLVGGIGLVRLAFFAEEHGWTGLGPEAILQLGASVGLVGILSFLERKFVRDVRSENRVIEERFAARTEALESRMDELASATSERRQERYERQQHAWARLDEEVSFDAVTHVLEEANQIGALERGTLDVQASSDLFGLRLEFAWGRLVSPSQAPVDELMVRALEIGSVAGGLTPTVELKWMPTMSAAEVGDAFTEALQRAGAYAGPEYFDWPTAMKDLRRVAEIAIRGRRRGKGDDPHMHGKLVTSRGDWIFTTAGLEHLHHGLIIAQEQFPAPYSRQAILGPKPSFEPPSPSWSEQDEWNRVIELGGRFFPRRPEVLALYGEDWVPKRRD